MSVFSDRLRWAREKSGMNQKEVSDKLGVSQQSYSNLELGKREPRLEILSKIPLVINESLDFLVGVDSLDRKGAYMLNNLEILKGKMDTYKKRLVKLDIEDDLDNLRNPELFKLYSDIIESTNKDFAELKSEFIEHVKTIPHALDILKEQGFE